MASRILVAGGGIGGLACALALARGATAAAADRGPDAVPRAIRAPRHRIDLLEQADAFGEVGAGLQLGPNATRRLHALGLKEALAGIAAVPDALVVRGTGGDGVVARLPLGESMHRHYGGPYCCVHRADLHAMLLDAVRGSDGTVLHLGARIHRIDARDEAVDVASADGRDWTGDALIGADGLWSAVRPQVTGAADPPPRLTGHTAWRALVPQAALPAALRGNEVRVWLGARLHAVAYPVRGGAALNVVVLAESAPAGDARDWDQTTGLDALQRATGRCGGMLQALIEAMPGWRAWTLCDRAPLAGPADMARGRIALAGDAAHPMLPYMAQGAGMAIEDAVALADALGGDGGVVSAAVPDALSRYATARWRRNARVQARARRNGVVFHLSGPARLARDAGLRALGPKLLDVPWLYAG
ncbi:MAG: FAD-dependent oxidoreductase [Variovorax sp.]|nr:MAG: FAD-dependent oxidoreductase [Variovorax sp.]